MSVIDNDIGCACLCANFGSSCNWFSMRVSGPCRQNCTRSLQVREALLSKATVVSCAYCQGIVLRAGSLCCCRPTGSCRSVSITRCFVAPLVAGYSCGSCYPRACFHPVYLCLFVCEVSPLAAQAALLSWPRTTH
jgi:hypothetical protein